MSWACHFVLCLATALLATSSAAADEVIKYAGATTLQRDFMPEAAQLFWLETGTPFRISGGNTDPGLRALQSGLVNLAGAGRFLRPQEKAAGLVETLIGWDAIVVLVHQTNSVDNLSLEQLQGIFSGRLGNWREVGGADQPILVITSPAGTGMREAVQSDLGLESYTANEIIAPLVADADRQVAALPTAIAAISHSMVDAPRVKSIRVNGVLPTQHSVADQSYPLVKPLLLVTRGRPEGAVARFLQLVLGNRGQEVLARRFYRLY